MRHDIEADHYRVLGVAHDASTLEIRRAYRRLARQHHPDHNPTSNGAERFVALVRAYEILNDPAQRAHYDQILLRRAPSARRPITPPAREGQQTVRCGIVELSWGEARHLARYPLALIDAQRRAIVLPAGAGHGDTIALLRDGDRITLMIKVHKKDLTVTD
jgi:curved DNA-binding protein CbpA